MTHALNRRDLLKAGLATGGVWLGTASNSVGEIRSANEKLNIACIGIGGRGAANVNGVADENIVALCDVDEERGGKSFERFPRARRFADFRKMLDQMENQIDAVVVSTPDHTHFHPSMMAMSMGKHLYCEKPMAHCVGEIRQMTELAAKQKLATQLGVQRHTLDNVHRVVEWIQAGVIGEIKEVHCWIGGDRGMPAIPSEFPAVPPHLNWDLWLGPAPEAPYHPSYCPYGWRFWWDYGTGEMGNWGCHILDIPYWALNLTYPTRVSATGPKPHPKVTPKAMSTQFDFPAHQQRGPIRLSWHHAQAGPEVLRQHKLPHQGNNTLFVGSEGMLLCGFGKRKLYPEEKFATVRLPEKSIPKSPGFYREWLDACRGGAAATCHFGYSGPMSETVLLGNTAFRAGDFVWNSATLSTGDNAAAQALIQKTYRQGWQLDKLL